MFLTILAIAGLLMLLIMTTGFYLWWLASSDLFSIVLFNGCVFEAIARIAAMLIELVVALLSEIK